MTSNEKKISLKSLKAEINDLREQLQDTKLYVEDLEKKLAIATNVNKSVKGNNKSQIDTFECDNCEFLCQSRKELFKHKTKEHSQKLKCRSCGKKFEKMSDLETHINSSHQSTEKRFECELCDKKFVLKWRLNKHQRIHTKQNNRKCHYFNNDKPCPFEELGCMFEHSFSKQCKFGDKCDKKLCSFQHNDNIAYVESDLIGYQKEVFQCEECDLQFNTETELGKHEDEEHEGWRVSRSFCDYFCRTEHDIHICWSEEDFQESLGFDIWSTYTGDESDTVFKCLKCDEEDDDKENMKKHIQEKHAAEKTSKCNFCTYENNSWLGLKKHYKRFHFNNH